MFDFFDNLGPLYKALVGMVGLLAGLIAIRQFLQAIRPRPIIRCTATSEPENSLIRLEVTYENRLKDPIYLKRIYIYGTSQLRAHSATYFSATKTPKSNPQRIETGISIGRNRESAADTMNPYLFVFTVFDPAFNPEAWRRGRRVTLQFDEYITEGKKFRSVTKSFRIAL